MKQADNIFLIGFSGSGKSTVGPLLAGKLGRTFVDIDAIIESRTGLAIADIFAQRGETLFRRLETESIADLVGDSGPARVVALGGGGFQSAANRALVRKAGLSIYLRCSVREIYRRMRGMSDRPLLTVRPSQGETPREAVLRRIRTLLDKRRRNYESADIVVSTTMKAPDQVADEIVRRVISGYGSR
jgi:shikimate kinase